MHILFVGRFLPARLKRIGALALVGTFLSAAAQATPLVWTLDQVSYGDGTLVTGSFTFDAATTTFSGLSLTTSGGSTVPSTNTWAFNTLAAGVLRNNGGITGFGAVDAFSANMTGAHGLSLFSTLGPLMTDAGGIIDLSFFRLGTCGNSDCSVLTAPVAVTGSGSFTASPAAVPEPLTLGIFGAGLAGAAALRRRKKLA